MNSYTIEDRSESKRPTLAKVAPEPMTAWLMAGRDWGSLPPSGLTVIRDEKGDWVTGWGFALVDYAGKGESTLTRVKRT